jgi:alkanesulfonate monooxygenase SsuD/methylene tetrahydromethanopterin reductase-like flavin-dependent oxidoreductase (luciferase family)
MVMTIGPNRQLFVSLHLEAPPNHSLTAAGVRDWYKDAIGKAEQYTLHNVVVTDTFHFQSRRLDNLDLEAGVTHPDAFALLGYLAAVSNYIGLTADFTPTEHEPFHIARALSSLDYASDGRAGWFPQSDRLHESERQTEEFTAVVTKLWDSWDDEALLADQESGRYLDNKRIRTIDHEGEFYKVQGPLSFPRPLQGYPVGFVIAESFTDQTYADIVIHKHGGGLNEGLALKDKLRSQTLIHIAAITVVVTDSPEEAEQVLKSPEPAKHYRTSSSAGAPAFLLAGTASQLALRLEHWFLANLLDGIHLSRHTLPSEADRFMEQVIPLLQKRGICRKGYPNTSLREQLGLPYMANPHTGAE